MSKDFRDHVMEVVLKALYEASLDGFKLGLSLTRQFPDESEETLLRIYFEQEAKSRTRPDLTAITGILWPAGSPEGTN